MFFVFLLIMVAAYTFLEVYHRSQKNKGNLV
jgi:hypothetical protein